MAFKKSTFICPYCFEEEKLSAIQFRCSNMRCKDVDDVEMTRYENGNVEIPKQGKRCFTPASKNAFSLKSDKCPDCSQKTHKVVCPACHNTLPESTLLGRDMIISVVGSRGTGKSHFVGVIIKELIDRIAPKWGGALVEFDDSMKRYKMGPGKLYEDLLTLEPTKSSVVDVNNHAYKPLIFTLNLKNKRLFGETIDCFTFVFFDTAGEDLNAADTMATVNKYIYNSAGIIFLIDPMQIPAVSNQLDKDIVLRATAADNRFASGSDDILTRVSSLIRNAKGMKSSQQIKIPVAAVFSKFDAIESIVPAGCTVLEPSPHCAEKAFVRSDWHNVNSEIQGLLKTWNANSFMAQLDVNYSNYSYFTASSLGLNNLPREDDSIDLPRPHRIEDPLLWLLSENKVIKDKK